MKQKLKNYLKLLILFFGILICFTACNNDEDEFVENKTASKYRIKIIAEKDFNKNARLSQKLEKLNKVKTNSQNRDIQNAEFGFTIDTDYAKYVESIDGSTHSYTFPIIRDEPNEITENLAISLQNDGTYKSFIVAYYFPDFNNIGVQSQEIDLDSDSVLNDIQQRDCVSWFSCNSWINVCDNCDESGDLTEQCASVSYHEVCDIIDAGDSATGGSTAVTTTGGLNPNNGSQWNSTVWSSGNGGGYTGSNYTPNIITSLFPFTYTHIKSLNKLTEKPQIKAKIAYLKIQTTGDIEYGFQFNLNGSTDPANLYTISAGITDVDNHGFKFEPPASIFTDAQMHNHYAGAASAFTSRDLYNFAKETNNSNNPRMAAILVGPNLKVYALKVNDATLAADFAKNYLTNDKPDAKKIKIMEDFYRQEVVDKANENCAGTCTDDQFDDLLNKHLASYLIRVYSGLILYEATEDSDGNFTWNLAF